MADSSIENKVMVNIFGEEYPIIGSSDPSYISRIADLVDTRMKETARSGRITARDKVAILTAMSLASELYEIQDGSDSALGRLSDQIDSLLNRLDSVL